MIDTTDTDLGTWKEVDRRTRDEHHPSGIQKFRNQNRADKTVSIHVREWNHRPSPDVRLETPETDGRVEKPSLETAKQAAIDYMHANQFERTGNRSATEAMSDIRAELLDMGIKPTDDVDYTGWTHKRGSTGYSLKPFEVTDGTADDPEEVESVNRPADADVALLHIVVCGKSAGLNFTEDVELQGDETIHVHDPDNPERLTGRVQSAVTAAGFEVVDGPTYSGHQRHWDHGVNYTATVKLPDDLERPSDPLKKKRRRRVGRW